MVGSLTIGIKADTKEFDKQIAYIERKAEDLAETIEMAKESPGLFKDNELKEMEQELEKLNNQLVSLRKRKAEANKQPIDNDGPGGFGGVIKKITKIGLGLIGLRTGIALLRSTVRTVADQNDEIATKLNTIKSVLANALTPVVTFIVNLFAKLIAYVSYILNGWFKWDILSNKTAKNTKKMKNNIGGANKEAAKLKRTLAGFDEMNILQKDGGVSSGGGGGGVSPDDMIDMSMFDKIEIPDWVKWIADNKDGILKTLAIIGTAFVTLWATFKGLQIYDYLSKIGTILESLSALQIFAIVAGAIITIKGIIDTISALTDDIVHLEDVLGGVGEILIGIGLIIAAFSPWGWVVVGIGLLAELASAFIDTRTEEEKLDEANKKVEKSQQAVNQAYKDFTDANKTQLNAWKSLQKAEENTKKVAKELGITDQELMSIGEELSQELADGTITVDDLTKSDNALMKQHGYSQEQAVKLYETYLDLKGSQDALKVATDKVTNAQENLTEKQKENLRDQVEQQLQVYKTTGKFEEFGRVLNEAYTNGAISADEAAVKVTEAMEDMDEATRQTFIKQLPADVKLGMSTIETSVNNILGKAYTLKFGMNTSDVTKKLDELKKKINSLPMGTFTIGIKKAVQSANGSILGLPRLAPGGIVSHPGPGINYRGANIGERGAEAVVPLTNSQMMSQLGETIARYVKIKAEVPIYVGNRQISREIRNINAEEDFAYNGG